MVFFYTGLLLFFFPANKTKHTLFHLHVTFSFLLQKVTEFWMNLLILGIISGQDEICSAMIDTINDQFPNKDLNINRLFHLTTFNNQSISNALQEATTHARSKDLV